jgi:hypothetical protein
LFKSEGGLSMDTLTGVISGKPLKGKSGTFKIKATGVSATN